MQAVAHPSGEGDGVALMQLRLGTVSVVEILYFGFRVELLPKLAVPGTCAVFG